jgi:hypothetical protein
MLRIVVSSLLVAGGAVALPTLLPPGPLGGFEIGGGRVLARYPNGTAAASTDGSGTPPACGSGRTTVTCASCSAAIVGYVSTGSAVGPFWCSDGSYLAGTVPAASAQSGLVWAASAVSPRVLQYSPSAAPANMTVPPGVSVLHLSAWGGGGGGSAFAAGGAGAFVQGNVSVTVGQVLRVIVGRGGMYNDPTKSVPSVLAGGAGSGGYLGGSGGGRSALQRLDAAADEWVDVAVAGGGGGGGACGSSGGAATASGASGSGGQRIFAFECWMFDPSLGGGAGGGQSGPGLTTYADFSSLVGAYAVNASTAFHSRAASGSAGRGGDADPANCAGGGGGGLWGGAATVNAGGGAGSSFSGGFLAGQFVGRNGGSLGDASVASGAALPAYGGSSLWTANAGAGGAAGDAGSHGLIVLDLGVGATTPDPFACTAAALSWLACGTASPSASAAASSTGASTRSASSSAGASGSASASGVSTATLSLTAIPTSTASRTAAATAPGTVSAQGTVTARSTGSTSARSSASSSYSACSSPSSSGSSLPTATLSGTGSGTASAFPTATLSGTASASASAFPTATLSGTASASTSAFPTATLSGTATATGSETPSPSITPSPSPTPRLLSLTDTQVLGQPLWVTVAASSGIGMVLAVISTLLVQYYCPCRCCPGRVPDDYKGPGGYSGPLGRVGPIGRGRRAVAQAARLISTLSGRILVSMGASNRYLVALATPSSGLLASLARAAAHDAAHPPVDPRVAALQAELAGRDARLAEMRALLEVRDGYDGVRVGEGTEAYHLLFLGRPPAYLDWALSNARAASAPLHERMAALQAKLEELKAEEAEAAEKERASFAATAVGEVVTGEGAQATPPQPTPESLRAAAQAAELRVLLGAAAAKLASVEAKVRMYERLVIDLDTLKTSDAFAPAKEEAPAVEGSSTAAVAVTVAQPPPPSIAWAGGQGACPVCGGEAGRKARPRERKEWAVSGVAHYAPEDLAGGVSNPLYRAAAAEDVWDAEKLKSNAGAGTADHLTRSLAAYQQPRRLKRG